MKFKSTESKKSGVTTYIVEANKEEWKLIYDLLTSAYISFPKNIMELDPTRNRIKNMRHALEKIIYGKTVKSSIESFGNDYNRRKKIKINFLDTENQYEKTETISV
jgi:hypothetical protein